MKLLKSPCNTIKSLSKPVFMSVSMFFVNFKVFRIVLHLETSEHKGNAGTQHRNYH